MKFIFVFVLCSAALNLFRDYVAGQRFPFQNDEFTSIHPAVPYTSIISPKHPLVGSSSRVAGVTTASYTGKTAVDLRDQLDKQFAGLSGWIVYSWLNCSSEFEAPPNALDMFLVSDPTPASFVTRAEKCLVDCTMRKMRIVTRDGFDDVEYIKQVKTLRYNYTSFDVNEQSNDTKWMVLTTVLEQSNRFVSIDHCFSFLKPQRYPTKINHAETCSEIIESYELAAKSCKNVIDPAGDSCESAWQIVQCLKAENLKRNFVSSFYPIVYGANLWFKMMTPKVQTTTSKSDCRDRKD